MNKKGRSEFETIMGGVVFLIILVILASTGIFSAIVEAFDIPDFGSFGIILAILFSLMIIAALFDKLLGK